AVLVHAADESDWIELDRTAAGGSSPAFPGAIWRGVDLQRSERGSCTLRPYRNVPWYVAFNSLDSGGLTQNFMSKPLTGPSSWRRISAADADVPPSPSDRVRILPKKWLAHAGPTCVEKAAPPSSLGMTDLCHGL